MSFQYIDIHTHLNLKEFNEDYKVVGERAREAGVGYINIGTGKETSEKAVALTRESIGAFATVGTHPTHTDEPFDIAYYRTLANDENVVAIGECGLDYFRMSKDSKEMQERMLIEHIELANELGKPLMLHVRPSEGSVDAYEDAHAILRAYTKVLGNLHFFAGTYDIAKTFWDIGFTTSFTGVITFASQYDEVIRNAPLSMLHAETDAPYVAPVPFRGKRNEPLYVREVYKRIAEIRGEDAETVRTTLVANAERFFGIKIV